MRKALIAIVAFVVLFASYGWPSKISSGECVLVQYGWCPAGYYYHNEVYLNGESYIVCCRY